MEPNGGTPESPFKMTWCFLLGDADVQQKKVPQTKNEGKKHLLFD